MLGTRLASSAHRVLSCLSLYLSLALSLSAGWRDGGMEGWRSGDQVRMRQVGTYLPGRLLPIGDIHTYRYADITC